MDLDEDPKVSLDPDQDDGDKDDLFCDVCKISYSQEQVSYWWFTRLAVFSILSILEETKLFPRCRKVLAIYLSVNGNARWVDVGLKSSLEIKESTTHFFALLHGSHKDNYSKLYLPYYIGHTFKITFELCFELCFLIACNGCRFAGDPRGFTLTRPFIW